jgi:hypothetical protein
MTEPETHQEPPPPTTTPTAPAMPPGMEKLLEAMNGLGKADTMAVAQAALNFEANVNVALANIISTQNRHTKMLGYLHDEIDALRKRKA